MGLETFGEKLETMSFEKEFGELSKSEIEVKQKVKEIFQENAQLNGLLVSDDLNMTDRGKGYRAKELSVIRNDAKDILKKVRTITGLEPPKELRDIPAAKGYYEEIKKAA
jgi:hypothetical protein